jgi:hypothetical protein
MTIAIFSGTKSERKPPKTTSAKPVLPGVGLKAMIMNIYSERPYSSPCTHIDNEVVGMKAMINTFRIKNLQLQAVAVYMIIDK